MDHPLPSASRWRARALLAATVAALELVVLVTIAVVALGQSVVGGVETAARDRALAPVKPKRSRVAVLDRSATSVVVLNGNGITGAAAETAARVKSLAYVVAAVGNAPRTDSATMVMYRGDHRREAKRLANDLGLKVVGPLDGLRERDLMGAHLAVVVGN